MRKPVLSLAVAVLIAVPAIASAHEFWTLAQPFSPRVGTDAQLFMYVGEYFEGVQVGYVTTHATMLRHYSAAGQEDLIGLVPAVQPIGQVPLHIAGAGTHLVAFDSLPNQLTLPADKFQGYLHDEGLDHIVREREVAGKAAEPGRERFRRNTKTLLRAGGKSDATYAVHTGQKLEMVPLDDPLSRPAGAPLRFKLLFDGKPVANALLRAWHHEDSETVSIRAITNSAGEVTYRLPFSGPWMISSVYMTASSEPAEADWDSYWGSLMFEVPGHPGSR